MALIHRTALAALIVVGLVGPAAATPGCYFDDVCTPQSKAPAPTASGGETGGLRTIAEHGSWIALTNGKIIMIEDRFDRGARFIIAYVDDRVDLAVLNPAWRLTKGETYTMKIEVDGDAYSGKAVAADETTLILERTADAFVTAAYTGRKARLTVGDDVFDMTLGDAAATRDDVVLYQKTSSR